VRTEPQVLLHLPEVEASSAPPPPLVAFSRLTHSQVGQDLAAKSSSSNDENLDGLSKEAFHLEEEERGRREEGGAEESV